MRSAYVGYQRRGGNVLATFCHQAEGCFGLFVPISSNERVGKMLVTDRLDVLPRQHSPHEVSGEIVCT